jgi:aminopeptidase N
VEPDFKMNDQFIIENLQYVFGIDALETSRPINIEVNTPAEINSMFDAISYEKGITETSINAFTPSGLKSI